MNKQTATNRLLFRVPEVAEMLGLSRSYVYELIQAGEFATVQAGRALRITAASVEAWVAAKAEAGRGSERL